MTIRDTEYDYDIYDDDCRNDYDDEGWGYEEEPYEENFLERVSAGLNRLIPVG